MSEQFPHPRVRDAIWDQCVRCGVLFGEEERSDAPSTSLEVNQTFGPVLDTAGREYETVCETDPSLRLMHPECYEKWHAEEMAESHKTLVEWSA